MSVEALQINVKDLRRIVDEMVEEKLAAIFKDAEDELEFTDELQEILFRQSKEIERGEPLEEAVKRLGLD